jgi:DNA-binding transcriptional regulator GbsR (MarR family)
MEVSSSNQSGGTLFIIPRSVMNLTGMTLSYLKIYELFFWFWNANAPCSVSIQYIIKDTGYSRKQIYQAIKFFESNNLLEQKIINGVRHFVKISTTITDDIREV